MNAFTRAYIVAALWASTDDEGEPLDANYTEDDIAPESLAQIVSDCDAFLAETQGMLDLAYWNGAKYGSYSEEYAGHDFFLTRNGHGAGFWDRGLKDGEKLTEVAKQFRESNPYVGDNGKIYFE